MTTFDPQASVTIPKEHLELARTIGADLLPTPSLPFAPLVIPQFKPYVGPGITLKRMQWPILHGYFTGLHYASHAVFAVTKNGVHTGSTETYVLESLMPHIDVAHGNVIAVGIPGVGAGIYNMALKSEVTSILVVANEVVVNAFKASSNFSSWSAEVTSKIKFAKSVPMAKATPTVDHLFVAGWQMLCDPRDMYNTQEWFMALGDAARYVTFWGQEVRYAQFCEDNTLDALDPASWGVWCDNIGMPIKAPEKVSFATYGDMCNIALDHVRS